MSTWVEPPISIQIRGLHGRRRVGLARILQDDKGDVVASRVGIVRFNTTATSVQIPKDSLSADHYYVAYVSAIVNTPKTPPLSGPQSITRVNATSFSGVFTP